MSAKSPEYLISMTMYLLSVLGSSSQHHAVSNHDTRSLLVSGKKNGLPALPSGYSIWFDCCQPWFDKIAKIGWILPRAPPQCFGHTLYAKPVHIKHRRYTLLWTFPISTDLYAGLSFSMARGLGSMQPGGSHDRLWSFGPNSTDGMTLWRETHIHSRPAILSRLFPHRSLEPSLSFQLHRFILTTSIVADHVHNFNGLSLPVSLFRWTAVLICIPRGSGNVGEEEISLLPHAPRSLIASARGRS